MILQNFKHDLRTFLGSRIWTLPLFVIKPINRQLIVNGNTDIVIEGYPRSANTYSVVAFQLAQKKEVSIAHHLHIPAQIMRAKQLGIPVMMLIRRPQDTITSLKIRHPEVDVRRALRDYLQFYRVLEPISDYPVIADFNVVIHSFSDIVAELNRRFNTDFAVPDSDDAFREKVFMKIDEIRRAANRDMSQIAVPTPEKERMKLERKASILAQFDETLLSKAEECYMRFVGKGVVSG